MTRSRQPAEVRPLAGGAGSGPPLPHNAQKVLAYITDSIELLGFAPSTRDICAFMGFESTNGARYHLRLLEDRGFISRTRRVARGIRICNPRPGIMPLPGSGEDGAAGG